MRQMKEQNNASPVTDEEITKDEAQPGQGEGEFIGGFKPRNLDKTNIGADSSMGWQERLASFFK